MGARDEQGSNTLYERAAWANIYAFRLTIAGICITTPLSVLAIVMAIPSVSKAVDARVPGAVATLFHPWSLPWPVFLMALFLCIWLGSLIGRRRGRGASYSGTAASTPPAPPKAAPKAAPKAPEPEEMDVADLAVLSHMAHRIQHVIADDIAIAMRTPTVTVIAALQRLQRWGLVTSGVRFWSLTVQGVEYVDKHEAIFLQTKT